MISGRAPAFVCIAGAKGAAFSAFGVAAKRLRDDAAMLPASVLRKNFLRVHFSIAVLWFGAIRAQLMSAKRRSTRGEMANPNLEQMNKCSGAPESWAPENGVSCSSSVGSARYSGLNPTDFHNSAVL
jgi:hypothetical protein